MSPAAYINIGHNRLMYSTIEQTQFTFILIFIIIFYFSSFHRLDLVFTTSTPWVVMVPTYLPSIRRLVRVEAPSLSADGTLNYCQIHKTGSSSLSNQTV
jgi:hypothetical protein